MVHKPPPSAVHNLHCLTKLDSKILKIFVGNGELTKRIELACMLCSLQRFVCSIAILQLSDISEAVPFYSSLIDPDRVEHELQTWNSKWFGDKGLFSSSLLYESDRIQTADLPATALDALEQCNPHFYPNIHRLLTILATLPITTASAERSFSTLRRLKTYLRSTMSSERLTSIALLNIHPDIPCPVEEVINRFSSECRRQNFLL